MKRLLLATLFLSLTHFVAKSLDASVGFATFKSPPAKSFVEVYLNIMGTTVQPKKLDSLHYQSAVEVLILIKKGAAIVSFEKYILNGPVSPYPLDFMDVRRIALEDGTYALEVEIQDMNDSTNHVLYSGNFVLDYQKQSLMLSDLQLVQTLSASSEENAFVKNGYHMNPLPYNFCYKTDSVLIFYQELYHSDLMLTEKFLYQYTIEKINGNGSTEPVFKGQKKLDPAPVNVLLIQKDISRLASGRYRLLAEVKNRAGDLLCSKEVKFDRSNPLRDEQILLEIPTEELFVAKLDSAELRYSLKAIASNVDDGSVSTLNTIIAKGTMETQRRFLYSFWARIDPNPEQAYQRYMEVARAVDKLYMSGFGYGFETDRGRVFMKYGKPNDIITVENETSAPPYEIWFYDRVPTSPIQTNVKFLFYNPSYAAGNYQILHSTCRGETFNERWEVDLYSDDTQTMQTIESDALQTNGGLNRRAREFFGNL
jgi:GWxTD domain-containing protein